MSIVAVAGPLMAPDIVTTASSSGNAFSVKNDRGKFSSPRGHARSAQKVRTWPRINDRSFTESALPKAGISVETCQRLKGVLPLLGVCLGHQSMGQAFGGTIVRAKNLMHGKTDMIHHDGKRLFAGLDNPFQATRYHSLVIQPDTLPKEFEVTAWANEAGGYHEIMGIAHREYPLYGVQFHPESFLTHSGYDILRKFLAV